MCSPSDRDAAVPSGSLREKVQKRRIRRSAARFACSIRGEGATSRGYDRRSWQTYWYCMVLLGSGKSTLARAPALALGAADVPWGVIDLDELSLIHPYPGRWFPRDNLRAIWPNYVAAVPDIKLIIPMVFNDEQEVELIREALPGARLMICETSAPIAVLKQRVTDREPTDELVAALRTWADVYHARSDHERIRHFRVVPHPATVDDSVRETLHQTGWLTATT